MTDPTATEVVHCPRCGTELSALAVVRNATRHSDPDAVIEYLLQRYDALAAEGRPASPRCFRTQAADRLWAFLVPHLPTALDAGFVAAAIDQIEKESEENK